MSQCGLRVHKQNIKKVIDYFIMAFHKQNMNKVIDYFIMAFHKQNMKLQTTLLWYFNTMAQWKSLPNKACGMY